MLKKMFFALAIAALSTGPATAGDCIEGSNCANCCPLAKAANERMATGHEAVVVSPKIRNDFVRAVLVNLAAI